MKGCHSLNPILLLFFLLMFAARAIKRPLREKKGTCALVLNFRCRSYAHLLYTVCQLNHISTVLCGYGESGRWQLSFCWSWNYSIEKSYLISLKVNFNIKFRFSSSTHLAGLDARVPYFYMLWLKLQSSLRPCCDIKLRLLAEHANKLFSLNVYAIWLYIFLSTSTVNRSVVLWVNTFKNYENTEIM